MDNGKHFKLMRTISYSVAVNVHTHCVLMFQVKQQISKEYSQIKDIQRTLSEMTLDLQSSQFASKFRTQTSETETKDPASWFRPDPDIWTPPPKDPDVWGPPRPEKYVSYLYSIKL